MVATSIERAITFGSNGNADEYLLYGWSTAEDYTWTIGNEAALLVSDLIAPHGFFVEFTAAPHVTATTLWQRLAISANSTCIGEHYLRQLQRLAWYCPAASKGDPLVVRVTMPDAVCPDNTLDVRILGIAFHDLRILVLNQVLPPFSKRMVSIPEGIEERSTGLDRQPVAMNFESLGVNCELGFFQRAVGIEPLGLFRFSSGLTISVINGLDRAFDRLGDPADIKAQPDKDMSTWAIFEHNYHMLYHTWIPLIDSTEADMVARESKRLTFLKKKILLDIAEGWKILVHQLPESTSLAAMLPLFLAIRRRGECNLLWCCPADDAHPPGLVEELMPGLMLGRLGSFSTPGRGISVGAWLNVTAAAILMARSSS